jgi:fatty-acyl-CoA synthase
LDKDDILAVRVGKVLYGGSAGADDLNGNVIEYKIIDGESGDEMPAGEFGELVCRGPIVTRGYYHNPGATSKVMMKEGWMKTGDIGRIDENGYLHYLGRCNDLYKINGENVSPLFLDKIISKCQNVKCVETVGVPDEKLGWIGVAFIDAVNDDREGREQIKTYCREKLAPYQLPKYYFFLSSKEWPRTVTGKVQKYKLRELAQRLLTADVQKECG